MGGLTVVCGPDPARGDHEVVGLHEAARGFDSGWREEAQRIHPARAMDGIERRSSHVVLLIRNDLYALPTNGSMQTLQPQAVTHGGERADSQVDPVLEAEPRKVVRVPVQRLPVQNLVAAQDQNASASNIRRVPPPP